ncbi:MAG: hypothetical protein IPO92_00405 [Saprospiraceae bacterium]|nr:hypothetical protein [Saprospiraceae bacterium]
MSQINSSGTFIWPNELINIYGTPQVNIALLNDNNDPTKVSIIIPFIKIDNSITAIIKINKKADGSFNYKFYSRYNNDYYLTHPNENLSNRPPTPILNVIGRQFALFEFAVCNSSVFPAIPPGGTGLQETGLCVQTVTVMSYITCYAITGGTTESRDNCCNMWCEDSYENLIDCPGSGGGSGGDGGYNPGWNGGGYPYGNGNGTNSGGSGNSVKSEFMGEVVFLDNWLNDASYEKLMGIANQADLYEGGTCRSIAHSLVNLLKQNNYSQASINAANCWVSGLSVTTNPSAPDDCPSSVSTPMPDLLNNFANMPPLAFTLATPNTQLQYMPCAIANSSLSSTQIATLLNAIDDFMPEDALQMSDSEGNPIPGLPPGQDYHYMAKKVVNLFTKYPGLDLSKTDLIYLLNNVESTIALKDFLDNEGYNADTDYGAKTVLRLLKSNHLNGPYGSNLQAIVENEYMLPTMEENSEPDIFPTFAVYMIVQTNYHIHLNQWKEAHPNQVPSTKDKIRLYAKALSEIAHIGLDICGMVPGGGEACDLTNGFLYAIEGDGMNSKISFASSIPIFGWVSTTTKYAVKAIKYGTKTVKLPYDATGPFIRFAGNLRDNMGIAVGSVQQAHHLIQQAVNIQTHNLAQTAAKSSKNSFHLHDPVNNGYSIHKDLHSGGSPLWNSQVLKRMEDKWDENPTMTPETAANIIKEIQIKCKLAIVNNPNTHINNINIVW